MMGTEIVEAGGQQSAPLSQPEVPQSDLQFVKAAIAKHKNSWTEFEAAFHDNPEWKDRSPPPSERLLSLWLVEHDNDHNETQRLAQDFLHTNKIPMRMYISVFRPTKDFPFTDCWGPVVLTVAITGLLIGATWLLRKHGVWPRLLVQAVSMALFLLLLNAGRTSAVGFELSRGEDS